MTGAQSLVIAGSALVSMGALVAGVWRARWRAAHTVVARAPMLARLPVLDQTIGFAPVRGLPPWPPLDEIDQDNPADMQRLQDRSDQGIAATIALIEDTKRLLFGDDRGGWVSGTCAGGPGDQWPGPGGEPPAPDDPGPLDELPAWTEDELARLHDAPTVFDVGWVESWLSDGWAERMAAEIRTWKVSL